MIERAERIIDNLAEDAEVFLADPWTQDAVLRNLEVIGEAAKGTSPALRTRYPAVPWREIAAFRDFFAHAYDKVAPPRIWAVVDQELPALLVQLRAIAAENGWS